MNSVVISSRGTPDSRRDSGVSSQYSWRKGLVHPSARNRRSLQERPTPPARQPLSSTVVRTVIRR